MVVTALIMAGGKATRMTLREEKPLLKIGGKPMIEHVLKALKDVKDIDEIIVVVSKHTPETAKLMEKFSVKVLETPGEGFVADVGYAVRKLRLSTVLTVSADLPLVTGEIIDKVVKRYRHCGKLALMVAVPIGTRERLGQEGEYVFELGNRRLVPAGINMIDGRKIDEKELEEEIYVVDKEEVTINVNTPYDMKIAEDLFMKRLLKKDSPKDQS